jgi:hypothetical protein
VKPTNLSIAAATAALVLCLAMAGTVSAQGPIFLPGDIFLTRHADEALNTSPGHWNHAAIYIGRGEVVEAQSEPGAVISTPLGEFFARYGEVRLLRLRVAPERYGEAAALRATQLIGTRYRLAASLPPILRSTIRGENCVSTVRRCYQYATGIDPRWRIPDDLNEYPAFRLVASAKVMQGEGGAANVALEAFVRAFNGLQHNLYRQRWWDRGENPPEYEADANEPEWWQEDGNEPPGWCAA